MDIRIEKDEIYEKILEENESIIYLSDMQTYELVYMTPCTLRMLKRPLDDTTYIGQMCYKVLQGLEAPCEFCNNHRLTYTQFNNWEHFNPVMNRYFSVRDKKVVVGGRELRMEIADDISQIVLEKQRLEEDLSAEKSLMLCIQNLTAAESHDQSINDLLQKICDLYEGERGYIFQFDYKAQTVTNIYEWCREGIPSEIANLQNLPIVKAKRWIDMFQDEKVILIESLPADVDPDSAEYNVLAPQGITSLAAVPLLKEKQIIGFIGVDNPKKMPEDLSLMQTIAQFVANDIEKRKILQNLERSSNFDLLTKVYNRNRYITDIKALCLEETLSIGVIFLDLNNLKETNDVYGHDYGDKMIQRTAGVLYSVFPDEVYRIGGDEFIVLSKRLAHEEFEKAVEKLRRRFQENDIHISLGVNWRMAGEDLKEAVLSADHLMYQEKSDGKKNRGAHTDLDIYEF